MDIIENKEKDQLEEFINPPRLEKAPEGFTDKVMAAVIVESVHSVKRREKEISRIVPLSVLLLMAALIIVAAATGNGSENVPASQVYKFFQNIKLPSFSTESLPAFKIHGVAIYITFGIFILVLLDVILVKHFHKKA